MGRIIIDATVIRCAAGAIAALLYGLALWLPADLADHANGLLFLEIGWMALAAGQPAWFANLIMMPQIVILLSGGRVSPVWAVVAMVLTIASLGTATVPLDNGMHHVIYGPGFFVWCGCAVFLVVCALVGPGIDEALREFNQRKNASMPDTTP